MRQRATSSIALCCIELSGIEVLFEARTTSCIAAATHGVIAAAMSGNVLGLLQAATLHRLELEDQVPSRCPLALP